MVSYTLSSVGAWMVYYYFFAHPRAEIEAVNNQNNFVTTALVTTGKEVSRTRKQV